MISSTSEPAFVRVQSRLWRLLKWLLISLGLIAADGDDFDPFALRRNFDESN